MATVTSFTAERMLVIENETVVDGEVQGDNLILLTREGTPIDAGNVRGLTGPPGPSGTIGSVNDQATSAVYAPRIFATKAALDAGWPTAPIGAYAVTTDTETLWQKNSSGWFVFNIARIYVSSADLAARWPGPPEGARAVTIDGDVSWYKAPAGWNIDNGVRVFANPTERDARWPSPPNGSYCVTLDLNAVWQRIGNVWQPPPGTMVYTTSFAIPDIATGAIWPGWAADIYQWLPATPFPFPVRIQALVSFSAGYGADWISWYSQLIPRVGGADSPAVNDAAGQAVWSSSSLIHGWNVPAGGNMGFNHWFVAGGMGGNSTNVHTGGEVTIQAFSRI